MRTRYPLALRIISVVTLTFFSWTFLSLWEIPTAIAAEKQKSAAKGQSAGRPVSREQRPEEKFEDALEAIRENADKAGKKSDKGEDDSAEREAIRARKTEIEEIDLELKKEFDATEQRLKAAKLPREILLRHAAFVENYTSNVNSLKKELDDIDKAKTKADRKAKIEKVRLDLEKTKPQKKHIPLDPNRLPHKQVRGKEKAPRLKKEEFERDFSRQKSRGGRHVADSRSLPDFLAHQAQYKPTVLAFNETASDIPFNFGNRSSAPQLAFSDATPILLAQQSADLPTPEDLAENGIEIQFTDAIRAKALELGCSPVKLYEFTRNSIEFVPTYGSIQGADMCLQTKQCNSIDTSSLLIAMLRSCSIPARYVYSTIEVPIDKIMNWTGNFTDPRAAINFVASGGTPIKPYASGGVITKAQMEHVFVETYVPYGPYSGRPSNLNPDKIWVPLDPSYKQYTYTEGINLQTAVPFDAQSFANQIQSTATINETESYVTNVDSNYIQTTITNYQTQIQNYISQNMPNATTDDIIGKKEIKKQEFGILPVTLPYKVITVGATYSEIPDNLRHKVTFEIQDSSVLWLPRLLHRLVGSLSRLFC